MTNDTILVTGACGQIGSELVLALRKKYVRVIASDLKDPIGELKDGLYERLDVLSKAHLVECVRKHKVTQIYHLAAILSATGEKNPELAWRINMKGLRNILDVCVSEKVQKLFFPSTIAVFGPNSPKVKTPQYTVMEPETIYGISKQAGELWCNWYHKKFGLDVRSLRYPGLISYKTRGGGGTTDYAIDIFFDAVAGNAFTCFLKADTTLPMMYMPDAIRATIALMESDASKISVRTSYNVAGFSFSPADLTTAIQQHIPNFNIEYAPDFRQQIAESWPQSIDDAVANRDWGWEPEFDLAATCKDMIIHISKK